MERQQSAIRSFRSSTPFITFVIAYAVFTDQFLFSAIIPIYPYSLQERINVSKNNISFWVAILMATFGIGCVITSIPWGLYTDRSKSRRWPFTIGLLILLGATFILWFTSTIAGQIAGRALQGLASTVVWTTGLAILVDTVGPEHIGEYMGHVTIALNLGSLVAPSLGGVVFAKTGYNAVFGVIVGVIILDIGFRMFMVEQSRRGRTSKSSGEESGEIDIELEERGVDQRTNQRAIAAPQGIVLPEGTSGPVPKGRMHPIFRLICSARFLAALWGFMVLSTVFSGFQATLPLFVHELFGWDAVGGGLIFIPLSLPSFLGPVVGHFTDRHGGRLFATAGFLLFMVSLVLLQLVGHNTLAQKALLCVLLSLVGCCMALIMEPLFVEITYGSARLTKEDRDDGGPTSERGYYGSAYAWFNIAWCTGNSIGPLTAGFIMNARGWNTMTWVLGLLCGVSALPVGLWCDGWFLNKKA